MDVTEETEVLGRTDSHLGAIVTGSFAASYLAVPMTKDIDIVVELRAGDEIDEWLLRGEVSVDSGAARTAGTEKTSST
jgi:hypothetical protein